MPDRVEAGTSPCGRSGDGGRIRLRDVSPKTLGAVLDKLQQAGAEITQGEDWIELDMGGRRAKAVDIERPRPIRAFRRICRRSS